MLTYLLRRILLMIPTLLGITLVVFTVMAISPGGLTGASMVGGADMKPEEKQARIDYYNKRYGLDDPAPVQYLRWLNNVSPIGFLTDENNDYLRFSFTKGSDLGESVFFGQTVAALIKDRLPITLLLNVITIPLIYLIAIIVGMNAARDRGGRFDVSSNVLMLALWSLPSMLVGVLLIGLFSSIQNWQWFPTGGLSSSAAYQMPFLPHWSSVADILKLLVFGVTGVVAGLVLAQLRSVSLRKLIAGLSGLALGASMAWSHPEFILANWVVWPLLFALVMVLISSSGSAALRITLFVLIGFGLAWYCTMNWLSDEFVRGYLLDRLWHLVLPIIVLSYGSFASLSKIMRTSILENLNADYARTARAKGVAEEDVLWQHVFRNSLLPLITIFAGILPSLLAGSVIVEQIFSIDGMGKLVVEATMARDRELILSITLISGILTLVGYLISDLMYTLVDPRVQYD
ncbi:ABC transporter permease [Leucothrix arctica]|uniref:ABC transporter permease n=1 Tax=Leucothrix arctica TaxID=1481894 RepID=A0A317C7C5_9GAMM|nr:ABC transporter permease [Leucothrix arctica]PWQ94131.1 ABC transporter permease [Leucothrix arctica]